MLLLLLLLTVVLVPLPPPVPEMVGVEGDTSNTHADATLDLEGFSGAAVNAAASGVFDH